MIPHRERRTTHLVGSLVMHFSIFLSLAHFQDTQEVHNFIIISKLIICFAALYSFPPQTSHLHRQKNWNMGEPRFKHYARRFASLFTVRISKQVAQTGITKISVVVWKEHGFR